MTTTIKKVTETQFHAHLDRARRCYNDGFKLKTSDARDVTLWTCRGVLVGLTRGPYGAVTGYFIDQPAA